jgi:hypothetical protein
VMLDNIVFPVVKATVCVTVKAEIASMSMSRVLKESRGTQRKMQAYLNYV